MKVRSDPPPSERQPFGAAGGPDAKPRIPRSQNAATPRGGDHEMSLPGEPPSSTATMRDDHDREDEAKGDGQDSVTAQSPPHSQEHLRAEGRSSSARHTKGGARQRDEWEDALPAVNSHWVAPLLDSDWAWWR